MPLFAVPGLQDTVLSCSNSNGALGYSFEFDSIVENSTLHGEKGTKDQPGWLQLDGNISPDGSASFYVKGGSVPQPSLSDNVRRARSTAITSRRSSPIHRAPAIGSKAVPAPLFSLNTRSGAKTSGLTSASESLWVQCPFRTMGVD